MLKTLEIALEILGGEASCFVGREMTKIFEEYLRGPLAEVLSKLKNGKILGEFTVILKP